jgi:hypothetical protein
VVFAGEMKVFFFDFSFGGWEFEVEDFDGLFDGTDAVDCKEEFVMEH